MNSPSLSVIICIFNMSREGRRTILSALPPYQKNVDDLAYEVIIVDNWSDMPVENAFIDSLGSNIKYCVPPMVSSSPVFALNWAAREVATGRYLMFCIDGARLFSDRLVRTTFEAFEVSLHKNAFVYTLAWHLGSKKHSLSRLDGYNQLVEDELLESIDWYNRPDRLFEISVFAGSSERGFFSNIQESNAFAVSRSLYEMVGGFDERFSSPGGGIANLEIFCRYVTNSTVTPICLLSEGTFHQYHGGVATGGLRGWDEHFLPEYISIFGNEYKTPEYRRVYFGVPRSECNRFYGYSLSKLFET
jgi:hypothetical protein